MKKISTVETRQSRNISEQKLTIGLDLGDRSSWYCGLDEAGRVVLEQRVSTTPKASANVLPLCRAAASRWKRGSTEYLNPHLVSICFRRPFWKNRSRNY
jgi:hypothetical protein